MYLDAGMRIDYALLGRSCFLSSACTLLIVLTFATFVPTHTHSLSVCTYAYFRVCITGTVLCMLFKLSALLIDRKNQYGTTGYEKRTIRPLGFSGIVSDRIDRDSEYEQEKFSISIDGLAPPWRPAPSRSLSLSQLSPHPFLLTAKRHPFNIKYQSVTRDFTITL